MEKTNISSYVYILLYQSSILEPYSYDLVNPLKCIQ